VQAEEPVIVVDEHAALDQVAETVGHRAQSGVELLQGQTGGDRGGQRHVPVHDQRRERPDRDGQAARAGQVADEPYLHPFTDERVHLPQAILGQFVVPPAQERDRLKGAQFLCRRAAG
jgi:hypothetical protein